MPPVQYRISVGRELRILEDKWKIQVSTKRRGTFILSGDLASKAEATRIARVLFRLNREPDFSGKGLSYWIEER